MRAFGRGLSWLAFALVPSALGACSLLLDDGFSDGASDGGSESGATDGPGSTTKDGETGTTPGDDASTDGGAGDADAQVRGPNIVVNGDFELGCAAWSAYVSTTTASNIARSGSSSCLVCVYGDTPFGDTYIYQGIEKSSLPDAGGRMLVEGWVRRAPDSGASLTTVDAMFFVGSSSAAEATVTTSLTEEWQPVRTVIDIGPNVSTLTPAFGKTKPVTAIPDGTCFLIDDVYVGQVPVP